MAYSNKLTQEIEKIYSYKRKTAHEASERATEALLKNEDYLKAFNKYNSTRFDLSKAKFLGDTNAVSKLKSQLKTEREQLDNLTVKLGFTDKDFAVKYDCNICSDTGRLESGSRCKCYKKLLHKLTLEELGLEKKKLHSFKRAGHKDVNDLEKIYAKMQSYCEKFPDTDKNIVIAGSVGTGKSYLAKCIANELVSKDYNVIFISACELNSILLKYHTAPIDEKGVYLDLLTECDLLVIDDLGSEPIYKNVTEEYLLMIITERMTKGNPFIITTNLEQEQLLDRYGDRTLSRLNDKRHGVFIKIKGEDLRRKRK